MKIFSFVLLSLFTVLSSLPAVAADLEPVEDPSGQPLYPGEPTNFEEPVSFDQEAIDDVINQIGQIGASLVGASCGVVASGTVAQICAACDDEEAALRRKFEEDLAALRNRRAASGCPAVNRYPNPGCPTQ
jgi:hypothetical protein